MNVNRIYLDNNATTQLNEAVAQGMHQLPRMPYNCSSIHSEGRQARSYIEAARNKILESLNVNQDYYSLVFTASGSEANNLVINSFKDDFIFTSSIEHASVLNPLADCSKVIILPVDDNGIVKLDIFESELKKFEGKKLVSIMLANNETGVIEPIDDIIKIARKHNAIIHCDGVQAYGKIKIDLQNLDIDLLTISAHKCGGPIGAACLVYKKILELKSQVKGGGQEKSLRAGTENVYAIVGFGIAAELSKQRIENYEKIQFLRDYLEEELQAYCKDVEIIAKSVMRLPNTSCIIMPKVKSEVQVISLDLAGIAVSSGAACSSGKVAISHVLISSGVAEDKAVCSIRVSLGVDTTKQEIDRFIVEWKKIHDKHKKVDFNNFVKVSVA